MRNYPHRSHIERRDTSRGLVVHDGKMLVIERIRPGLHYYSIPGGGIEDGEEPSQTAAREMKEETSVNLKLERKVFEWHEGTHLHHFYLFTFVSGVPKLADDAEEQFAGPDNIHKPMWMPIDELMHESFGYWEPIKDEILYAAKNGFGDTAKIMTNKAVV